MPGTGQGTLQMRSADAEDLRVLTDLLEHAELPTVGVAQWLTHFVLAERDGKVVGAAGLELYDAYALLRSVVVHPDERGQGTGAALVEHALEKARAAGVREVVLLTTTAERWFPRFGFRRIDRAEVPPALFASEELRGACPATAAILHRLL